MKNLVLFAEKLAEKNGIEEMIEIVCHLTGDKIEKIINGENDAKTLC